MNKNLFIVTFATILILAMAITGCANSALTPAPTQEGLTVCESGGGYLNPDNPDEYTSGVYPDDFGVCPENYGCLVNIPVTGVCVPIYPTKEPVAAITRAVTFTATATPEVVPVLPTPTIFYVRASSGWFVDSCFMSNPKTGACEVWAWKNAEGGEWYCGAGSYACNAGGLCCPIAKP